MNEAGLIISIIAILIVINLERRSRKRGRP